MSDWIITQEEMDQATMTFTGHNPLANAKRFDPELYAAFKAEIAALKVSNNSLAELLQESQAESAALRRGVKPTNYLPPQANCI
jgi:hypothetical protein